MSLESRKHQELTLKLASIRDDLAAWRKASAENGPYEKHNSQIARLATRLEAAQRALEEQLETAKRNEAVLSTCRSLELQVLELFRIWDFFRSKLAQRALPQWRPHLEMSDELAWSCYEPVRKAAQPALGAALKEPPLVFFNPSGSPFVFTRGTSYEIPEVPGSLSRGALADILRGMPFAVIGIPWFQISHLPDVLIVAHEVGHAVQADFDLTGGLKAQLEAVLQSLHATPERAAAWRAWLDECFADAFGTVAMGPAFTSSLIDFVARDPNKSRAETRAPGRLGAYPTDHLRISLSLAALAALGFDEDVASLRAEWAQTFGKDGLDKEYENDAAALGAALATCAHPTLSGKSLRELVAFKADSNARAAAAQVNTGIDPTYGDVRVLAAAARHAFAAAPDQFVATGAADKLVARVLAVRAVGVRNSPKGEGATEANARKQDDVDAGLALFNSLRDVEG